LTSPHVHIWSDKAYVILKSANRDERHRPHFDSVHSLTPKLDPIPLRTLKMRADVDPGSAPGTRADDWTDGATDQAIAIAIEARDRDNPPGEGDSISGSLIQMDGGGWRCEV
jgi:hypothetical protein